MSYKIFIEKTAQKSLSKIQKKDQNRIIDSIYSLSDNPRPNGSKTTIIYLSLILLILMQGLAQKMLTQFFNHLR